MPPLFSTRQALLTTASMFTVFTTTFRSARTALLLPATRPFSCIDRLRQAPVRNAEEEAAHLERQRLRKNALRRQRWANDPEVRQRKSAYYREHLEKNRDKHRLNSIRAHAERLSYRRSKKLNTLLHEGVVNDFTWKTHTYIRYPGRVAHQCTGCNRDRVLKLWWKEKPEVSEESGPDRYMCNHCFANDWPRVVPETYTGRLASIFRSPELPLSRAPRAGLTMEKETESDKPQE